MFALGGVKKIDIINKSIDLFFESLGKIVKLVWSLQENGHYVHYLVFSKKV